MNKAANAKQFDVDISDEVEAAESNVVKLHPDSPEAERERIAKAHRLGAMKYEQRIADNKKQAKLDIAQLEADRAAERERHTAQVAAEKKLHDDEMAALAEQIADRKAKLDLDTTADRRLAASCHAALAELVRE